MANLYVRSTDGSNSDNGTTWALAKATIAGAAAIDAAGDIIYVSDAHAESGASASHAWAGTNASPVRVIGGDDAAEPPTSLSTAPTLTVSGTTFTWQGAVYTYGVSFIFTSASGWAPTFNDGAASRQLFDTCKFRLDGANGGQALVFGTASGFSSGETELRDCTIRFAATGQRVYVYRELIIRGGSWESGGTAPTAVFNMGQSARPGNLYVEGFDFSALGSSVNLIGTVNEGGTHAIFRNCKLPASWSGALIASGQHKLGSRAEAYNCSAGDTNYNIFIDDYAGTVREETTIKRTGGMSNGTTAQSLKMVSSANVAYPTNALAGPEVSFPIETTGSPITVTFETVTDNVTLTDAECWIEVQYPSDASFPLSSFARDVKVDVLATAANQATSTETWTTTGLSTPVTQKLSVTFTPQELGTGLAVVKLAKANTTVYVDYEPVLT